MGIEAGGPGESFAKSRDSTSRSEFQSLKLIYQLENRVTPFNPFEHLTILSSLGKLEKLESFVAAAASFCFCQKATARRRSMSEDDVTREGGGESLASARIPPPPPSESMRVYKMLKCERSRIDLKCNNVPNNIADQTEILPIKPENFIVRNVLSFGTI